MSRFRLGIYASVAVSIILLAMVWAFRFDVVTTGEGPAYVTDRWTSSIYFAVGTSARPLQNLPSPVVGLVGLSVAVLALAILGLTLHKAVDGLETPAAHHPSVSQASDDAADFAAYEVAMLVMMKTMAQRVPGAKDQLIGDLQRVVSELGLAADAPGVRRLHDLLGDLQNS